MIKLIVPEKGVEERTETWYDKKRFSLRAAYITVMLRNGGNDG